MTTVTRKDGESLEDTLKRLTLREARRREHYEKPSDAKKIKRAEAARKRKSMRRRSIG